MKIYHCCFKILFYFDNGSYFVCRSITVCEISSLGTIGNVNVNLF